MARIYALRVVQPIGEFYVTVLPARDIISRVRNRPRASNVAESEDVQRIFTPRRIRDIAEYTKDPDATFPTPIILAVDSTRIPFLNDGADILGDAAPSRLVEFDFPEDGEMVGDVLDGQHRVLGLLASRFQEQGDFDLVVVLMVDLDADDKAYVFSIINSKQTPVSSSLIYDLFDLSEDRSPQKTCHLVAQAMNRQKGGPFFQRIKMLGRKEPHHENRVMLSQGTFAARMERLITKNAARDASLEKLKQRPPEEPDCLLRKYYLRKEDATILKVFQNFFEAARGAFEEQWEDDSGTYLIRKSVGYTALIKVLTRLLPEALRNKNLSLEFFQEKFVGIKANLGNVPLTSESFDSSGAGADQLADALYPE